MGLSKTTVFAGTRDEKAVSIMRQRIDVFGLLLGGVPSLDEDTDEDNFVETVLRNARNELKKLNRGLCVS